MGSGLSKNASIAASGDHLLFTLKNVATVGTAGARLLIDPAKLKTWDGLSRLICALQGTPLSVAALIGRTLVFENTWNIPTEIPNYYGDSGFMSLGWQFKNDASAGAPAGMAMNLHTFRPADSPVPGMRWWLQANDWDTRGEDDTFPIIPVGVDVKTKLTVHFDSDPAKGWMQLDYAGKSLKIVGANCAPDGGCGAYMCLYGTVDATLFCRAASITLLG